MSRSLAYNGYKIHIVSRNVTGLPIEEEIDKDIFVNRLPRGFGKLSRYLINFPAFFSPFWLIKIFAIARRYRSKLILVRDLPLAPAAIIIGRLLRIPVLMDMAENYPAMIQDTWRFRGPRLIDFLIRNPAMLRKVEGWVLRRIDGLIVVSQASRERVIGIIGARLQQIWVVSNTPRLKSSQELYPHPLVDQMRKHTGIKLLYTGGLEESRGVEIVIRSVAIVKKNGVNIQFVIVGQGSSDKTLKFLTSKMNVDDNVIFAGWVDPKFIPSVIGASDICIVPHYVSEHTDTTIPNKIFDYMAQRKPVIVTNAESLEKIVVSCRCGRVYQDKDPDHLARTIVELTNCDLRSKMGEAGYMAITERFNWEIDEIVLVSAVKEYYKNYLSMMKHFP